MLISVCSSVFSFLPDNYSYRSLSLSLLLFLAPRQFLKNSNNKRKRKKRKVYGCLVSLAPSLSLSFSFDYKGVIVLRKYMDQINAIVSACDLSITLDEKIYFVEMESEREKTVSSIIIKREREREKARIEKKQTTWSVLLSFLFENSHNNNNMCVRLFLISFLVVV